jgi:Fe-S-cluster containining protein
MCSLFLQEGFVLQGASFIKHTASHLESGRRGESRLLVVVVVVSGSRCRSFSSLPLHVSIMASPGTAQFQNRIISLQEERAALEAFSLDELTEIIRDVGFSCDLCGQCCTRRFNGHIFLFTDEADKIRAIDPSALEPPPVYDTCDQNGVLYVSGYTIRSKNDQSGSCWFFEGGKCQIYNERPGICRTYPYMLHREPDEKGVLDWRQISGLDQHGTYHDDITQEEALQIAGEIKVFESSVLSQEISFLEMLSLYFSIRNLRPVRKKLDDQIRKFREGSPITVMVYHSGGFERWKVEKTGGILLLP